MKVLVLALTAVSSMGCMMHFGSGIKGSGKMTTETRTVSGFTRITHEAAGNVHVVVGSAASFKLTVDDNLAKHIKTVVKDGELVIKTDKDIDPTKLEIVITVPKLTEFTIDGAGNTDIKGIAGDSFGGHIDGAGDLTLSGSANSGELTIDGAGDIKAYDLALGSATAKIDGAGSIQLSASERLEGSIDGAGDIRYHGSPAVKSNIDGAGSIKKG